MKKIIYYLSNGTLIIGAVLAIYILADTYLLKRNLPSGVCPVIRNRPLIYAAIALCCISFVLSFFGPKNVERNDVKKAAETVAAAESEAAEEAGYGAETGETEAETEAETGAETKAETGAETEAETDAETEAETDAETKAIGDRF